MNIRLSNFDVISIARGYAQRHSNGGVNVEHYNMLVRMVQAGAAPQLRVEVGTRSYENDLNSYNVLADITGTDAVLRHEVVLVGAHLDSWHTATGATDNPDGVTAAMESHDGRPCASSTSYPRCTLGR